MNSRCIAGAVILGALVGCSSHAPAEVASNVPVAPSLSDADVAYVAEVDRLASDVPQGRIALGYDHEVTAALGKGYCASVASAGGSRGAQAQELARMQQGMDGARQTLLFLMANAAEPVYCPEYT